LRGALARATRDEPGLRESLYQRAFSDPDSAPLLLEPRGESGRYFYSELTDDDTNGEISWQVPFGVWSDLKAFLKVGGAYRYRDRDFAARRFNWRFIGGVVDNIDSALTDSTILGQVDGPGTFALSEFRQPGDRYKVDDRRYAGYGMVEVPFTSWLRGIVGVGVFHERDRRVGERGIDDGEVEALDHRAPTLPHEERTKGDAPPRVKDHIARYAFCAAEIEALRKIETLFWGALLEGGDLVVDKSFSSADPDGKRT